MQLKWSEFALEEYDAQLFYLALENEELAVKTQGLLEAALDHLLAFPEIGRAGRCPETFEFSVKKAPLLIVYEVQGGILTVLRILHTSRNYP
jgi:toxin ParE1/3/4